MIISKLSSRAQTTIPEPVGTAVRLREGDESADVIEPYRVVLTRSRLNTLTDEPFEAFSEWNSLVDTHAFVGL